MEFTKGKSVNKSQLIEALAGYYDGNKKAAEHALKSVIDTVTREVSKGEKVEQNVDTGANLVTKANMAEPKIDALLNPKIK